MVEGGLGLVWFGMGWNGNGMGDYLQRRVKWVCGRHLGWFVWRVCGLARVKLVDIAGLGSNMACLRFGVAGCFQGWSCCAVGEWRGQLPKGSCTFRGSDKDPSTLWPALFCGRAVGRGNVKAAVSIGSVAWWS
jgi:hypothetical protein